MKKTIAIFTLIFGVIFGAFSQTDGKMMSDKTEVVKLVQTPGEFTQKELSLKPGTYVFEVSNQNVGHDVGFVLIKKGDDPQNPKNHIQTAYTTKAIANGTSERSNPTVLAEGEYYYFCPLNPTATDNLIVVK